MSIASVVLEGYGPGGSIAAVVKAGFAMSGGGGDPSPSRSLAGSIKRPIKQSMKQSIALKR